ncbi:hypothetical protein U9M48_028708 [Paspalum notatum var. saurae]|uniref:Uncharacterized protein n=1 Tax=Paspalum notatum var. saurae TaxID=547442 RepID=A0AAQ3TXB8_PASNO
MEDRRRQGLCFNCDEKYSRGHNRVCKQLFVLEFGYPSDTDDDAEEKPPAAAEADQEPAPVISLHAISGVRTGRTMQVPVRWGATVLNALLDSARRTTSSRRGRAAHGRGVPSPPGHARDRG